MAAAGARRPAARGRRAPVPACACPPSCRPSDETLSRWLASRARNLWLSCWIEWREAMATPATTVQITMPAMGESVTEGVVLEWLKQVGDRVEVDEGLVEISTDKVDAEVPSPAAGILTAINVAPDETVTVGTVLGEIEVGEGGSPPAAPAAEPEGGATSAGNGSPPPSPAQDLP